jgi:hypothetical protein
MNTITRASLAGLCLSPSLAHAQLTIDWFTTDGGGGDTAGGTFTLSGTIGQPDADVISGGALQISGGYWAGIAPPCYANCDGSTSIPVLNVTDFTCFLQRFATADLYANCDGSTSIPVLNVSDFTCFLQKFAQGCP